MEIKKCSNHACLLALPAGILSASIAAALYNKISKLPSRSPLLIGGIVGLTITPITWRLFKGEKILITKLSQAESDKKIIDNLTKSVKLDTEVIKGYLANKNFKCLSKAILAKLTNQSMDTTPTIQEFHAGRQAFTIYNCCPIDETIFTEKQLLDPDTKYLEANGYIKEELDKKPIWIKTKEAHLFQAYINELNTLPINKPQFAKKTDKETNTLSINHTKFVLHANKTDKANCPLQVNDNNKSTSYYLHQQEALRLTKSLHNSLKPIKVSQISLTREVGKNKVVITCFLPKKKGDDVGEERNIQFKKFSWTIN